jgi:uncharacterized protein (DUF433 family)
MARTPKPLKGVIRGKTIELEQEPGLPEGQRVAVEIRPVEETAPWVDRLVQDPSVGPGKLLIKGTRLPAEDLARLVEEGRGDEDLRRLHPELTPEDLEAVRQYARVPEGLRRALGAWAEDGEALDQYLDWNRRQRQVCRREIDD